MQHQSADQDEDVHEAGHVADATDANLELGGSSGNVGPFNGSVEYLGGSSFRDEQVCLGRGEGIPIPSFSITNLLPPRSP